MRGIKLTPEFLRGRFLSYMGSGFRTHDCGLFSRVSDRIELKLGHVRPEVFLKCLIPAAGKLLLISVRIIGAVLKPECSQRNVRAVICDTLEIGD